MFWGPRSATPSRRPRRRRSHPPSRTAPSRSPAPAGITSTAAVGGRGTRPTRASTCRTRRTTRPTRRTCRRRDRQRTRPMEANDLGLHARRSVRAAARPMLRTRARCPSARATVVTSNPCAAAVLTSGRPAQASRLSRCAARAWASRIPRLRCPSRSASGTRRAGSGTPPRPRALHGADLQELRFSIRLQ